MSDIVITIPMAQWRDWSRLGDRAGMMRSFHIYGARPPISDGDLLYVAAFGRVRYALEIKHLSPLRRGWFIHAAMIRPRTIVLGDPSSSGVRDGSHVGVSVEGFKGWRLRWWQFAAERDYPEWQTDNVRALDPPAHVVGDAKQEVTA